MASERRSRWQARVQLLRERWPLGLAVLLAVCVAAGAAVWLAQRSSSADGGSATSPAATVRAVCTATAQASAGDLSGAERTFRADAHDGLHELAADLGERDRAAAARLLEDKQGVEAAADAPANSGLADALRALTATVVAVVPGSSCA